MTVVRTVVRTLTTRSQAIRHAAADDGHLMFSAWTPAVREALTVLGGDDAEEAVDRARRGGTVHIQLNLRTGSSD